MIVREFNIVGVAIFPDKADAPLIVDADRPLPSAVSDKPMETIARRNAKVFHQGHRIEQKQLGDGPLCHIGRNPFGNMAIYKARRAVVAAGLDHNGNVQDYSTQCKGSASSQT